jgi:hypothetical protein
MAQGNRRSGGGYRMISLPEVGYHAIVYAGVRWDVQALSLFDGAQIQQLGR